MPVETRSRRRGSISHEEHAEDDCKVQENESHLVKSQERRQEISIRKTRLRVLARNKLKSSRALSQVPAFSHLSERAIETIVDSMKLESFPDGSVLCREGEDAKCMFVIVSGTCRVTSERLSEGGGGAFVKYLRALDIFGESMMCQQKEDV